jgi:uncharacterized membrane protein
MAPGATGRSLGDVMLHRPTHDASLERLVLFSDAVFAIAITLLVLDLRPPDGELPAALLETWPHIVSYAITVVVIGAIWITHVRLLQVVARCDTGLLWLNLVFLGCVGLLPFHTALLGGHFGDRSAVLFYSVGLALARLAAAGVWWYAAGRRLLDPESPAATVQSLGDRLLLGLAVSLLGVLSSLLDPSVPKIAWLLAVALPLVGWRTGRLPSLSRYTTRP